MNLLFIHSLLDGDYHTFAAKMLVEVIFWLLVILAVIADLISGVHKARLRNEARMSYGFKRTVSKFIMYFSALMLALLIDCALEYVIISFNTFIPSIPYATIMISLYIIIFVEGRSILEKAGDKQKKQLSEDVLKTLQMLDKIKEKEVFEYLGNLVKENKNNHEQIEPEK